MPNFTAQIRRDYRDMTGLVFDLRSENLSSIEGTHTGSNDASVLTDSSKNWVTDALVGKVIHNVTDSSHGTITANTPTTVTVTLSSGVENDWDTGDAYAIQGDADGILRIENAAPAARVNKSEYSGTHDGGNNQATLEDSNAPWTGMNLVGMVVYNVTDGSMGWITANDATTVTATLFGGVEDDWDDDDVYLIADPRFGDAYSESGDYQPVVRMVSGYRVLEFTRTLSTRLYVPLTRGFPATWWTVALELFKGSDSSNSQVAFEMDTDEVVVWRRNSAGLAAIEHGYGETAGSADHPDGTAVLRSIGIINWFEYSEAFEEAPWINIYSTAYDNETNNPLNGQMTAALLKESTDAASAHYIRQSVLVDGSSQYCFSVYAKKKERYKIRLQMQTNGFPGIPYANFDLDAGTYVSGGDTDAYGIEDVSEQFGGEDWYRLYIVATSDAAVANFFYIFLEDAAGNTNYNGDGVSGLYLFGAHLEIGNSPSDYERTTDAPSLGVKHYQAGTELIVGGSPAAVQVYADDADDAIWLGGSSAAAGSNFFDGQIRTVKVFDRLMSPLEVDFLFHTMAADGSSDSQQDRADMTLTVWTDDTSFDIASSSDSGTHTGSNNASVLIDSSKTWITNSLVGRTINNTTDGSSGVISANSANTVTVTLSGGTDDDWDTGDAYTVSNVDGVHTGSNNASALTDATKSWPVDSLVGGTILNSTDGSSGKITANTTNTVTAILSGGTDNDWDTGDAYTIQSNEYSRITRQAAAPRRFYLATVSGTARVQIAAAVNGKVRPDSELGGKLFKLNWLDDPGYLPKVNQDVGWSAIFDLTIKDVYEGHYSCMISREDGGGVILHFDVEAA